MQRKEQKANEIRKQETAEKLNETESWAFEKSSKNGKTSSQTNKVQKERLHISNTMNDTGAITTGTTDAERMTGG